MVFHWGHGSLIFRFLGIFWRKTKGVIALSRERLSISLERATKDTEKKIARVNLGYLKAPQPFPLNLFSP
ncbi:hypothetical protein SYNPCC7002_A2768 [Picosynechococcus sp. PCC 7002]|nr:hypothetical protein SYNPCC7002_A2768 [Picosynechococcus sp. PCC 7002]